MSLDCKEYVKYLGVIIDSHLSWKFHVDYVAMKISRNIGIISKLRHIVPLKTLKLAVTVSKGNAARILFIIFKSRMP